jgi:uncharacterized phage protein (TIGR02218 family)
MSTLWGHLQSGATTVARAWALTHQSGRVMGFTDHDRDLTFDGIVFRAETGMTARAISQTTGLAVDNTEALGMLSAEAIREADILAGRYDRAEVRAWLVNWADVNERQLLFRGTIGEVVRGAGAFKAELRGLSELLNQPQGRVYQRSCAAVLGDKACRVDLSLPGYFEERVAEQVDERRILRFAAFQGFADRWFEKGRVIVLSGPAEGLVSVVKADRLEGVTRRVELWESLRADLRPGDMLRFEAGCDKRAETCRLKFDNLLNFRGFPHLPTEAWLTAVPRSGAVNDGGSLG